MANYLNIRCKHCGDIFHPTMEELQNFEDGISPLPDTCDNCIDNQEHPDFEYMQHSDADPGL